MITLRFKPNLADLLTCESVHSLNCNMKSDESEGMKTGFMFYSILQMKFDDFYLNSC